jgi:hypothetical protein
MLNCLVPDSAPNNLGPAFLSDILLWLMEGFQARSTVRYRCIFLVSLLSPLLSHLE